MPLRMPEVMLMMTAHLSTPLSLVLQPLTHLSLTAASRTRGLEGTDCSDSRKEIQPPTPATAGFAFQPNPTVSSVNTPTAHRYVQQTELF
jgi:hypothetical protein